MLKTIKHTFLKFAALSMFASSVAFAQPSGPITVVVPAPAGSLHDNSFRSLVPSLEKITDVKFNVDYKPGAAGVIGTNYFLGHEDKNNTVLVIGSISHAMGPISNPDAAKWDIVNDFQYITELVVNALAITTATDGDLKSINDLVTAMQDPNRTLTVGVTFPNQKVIMLDIAKRLGTPSSRIKFINYNNPIKAATDLVGKNIDVLVGAVSPTVALKESGKVNWIAVTSKEPLDIMPGVPTLNSKFPGLVQISVSSVVAGKSMSKENVEWLRKVLGQALTTPETTAVRTKMKGFVDKDLLDPTKLLQFHVDTRKEYEPIWSSLNAK